MTILQTPHPSMTEQELLQVIEEAAQSQATSLYLGGNQLSSLPGEIGQLTNLQSLHLSRNQLRSLPGEIGQLTNLQSLYLMRKASCCIYRLAQFLLRRHNAVTSGLDEPETDRFP